MPLRAEPIDHPARRGAPRTTPLIVACALVPALWAQVAIIDRGIWHARFTVGLMLIVPALVLWALARHQLGDAFTPRAEAHRLVTHGLYARIRHPIYLFAEVAALGIIVFMGPWWLLVVWVAAVAWQISRARRENHVLEDRFGDAYRAYRDQTWF